MDADYAAIMAKADGLPVGEVLAVDIENSYQLSMGSRMQPVAEVNTRTIDSEGQASHPGDSGHQLIGEAVIRSFDF